MNISGSGPGFDSPRVQSRMLNSFNYPKSFLDVFAVFLNERCVVGWWAKCVLGLVRQALAKNRT